ncbi:MAG TPA: sulfite exporter TauE/SafE family protein [Burkholderiaceae bacterium]|nr:sulfite exporter TauE/SafE family protein [Burkholderiaceae bacterium]
MLPTLAAPLVAAFMLSLLGGVHCAGMCGGVVGALQINRPKGVSHRRLSWGYHAGRVISYSSAGALAGAVGGQLFTADILPVQIALLVLGSIILLAVGASVLGRRSWLRRLEPLGVALWRVIAPLARRVYPPRTARQSLLAGFVWGFIPCGMVYAALPLALVAGGAWQGAAVMFAFGLGTLPNMVLVDQAVVWLRKRALQGESSAGASANRRLAWIRPIAGAAIIAFGVSGLAHAARVAGAKYPLIDVLASICHH